jgi:hypothetical protein
MASRRREITRNHSHRWCFIFLSKVNKLQSVRAGRKGKGSSPVESLMAHYEWLFIKRFGIIINNQLLFSRSISSRIVISDWFGLRTRLACKRNCAQFACEPLHGFPPALCDSMQKNWVWIFALLLRNKQAEREQEHESFSGRAHMCARELFANIENWIMVDGRWPVEKKRVRARISRRRRQKTRYISDRATYWNQLSEMSARADFGIKWWISKYQLESISDTQSWRDNDDDEGMSTVVTAAAAALKRKSYEHTSTDVIISSNLEWDLI